MNKLRTDGLTFLFRFCHTFQKRKEMLRRIFMNQFDLEFVRKCIYHLFRFALPEESVIYKYAGQFVPNRFMDKDSGNRRVHTAGKSAEDIMIAHLLPDIGNSDVDIIFHRPAAFTFADTEKEILQHLCTFSGMDDFRMKLDGIETPCFISHRRGGRQFRMSDQAKTGRHIGDRIAVAHPYGSLF